MTPEEVLREFAQGIVDKDFARAEARLAPWVRAGLPDGGLKTFVRRARGEHPPASEFDLASYPYNTPAGMREHVSQYVGANERRTLATCDGSTGIYGPPSFPIPDALTDATFRGVWGIQFLPDEDLGASVDYSYAFYAAVVADGDGLAIGYLEPME